VFEVEVDRTLGDAGLAGDVLEGRGRKAAVGKDFQRRRDDFLGAGVFAALPARFGTSGTGWHEGQKLLTERSVSNPGSHAVSTWKGYRAGADSPASMTESTKSLSIFCLSPTTEPRTCAF